MAKKNKFPTEIPTKDIERVARENGLEIRHGKGSHMKIIGPAGRGYRKSARGLPASAGR